MTSLNANPATGDRGARLISNSRREHSKLSPNCRSGQEPTTGFRGIRSINVDEVFVPEGRRAVDADKVAKLGDSLARLGLLCPILVSEEGGRIRLVAGAHRLAAAVRLKWSHINAIYIRGDDVRLRLAEITENLHRAELTEIERAELTTEWIRLTEREVVSGQNVRKPQGGRPEGGIAKAARDLPVAGKTSEAKRKNVARALKVASLSLEAKEAARDLGLDGNRSALLEAAKESEPQEQVAILKSRALPKKAVKHSCDAATAKEMKDGELTDLEKEKILNEIRPLLRQARQLADKYRNAREYLFFALRTQIGGLEREGGAQ